MFLIKSNVFAVDNISEGCINNIKSTAEYQSGDYYVFAGTLKPSTLEPWIVRYIFYPKASNPFFYVNYDNGNAYSVTGSSGSAYKAYQSNLDGTNKISTI